MRPGRRTALALTVVGIALLGWSASPSALCLEPGQPAPGFTAEDLAGRPVRLADYRGKVVLLAFWASWCPRCMEELAFLRELHEELSPDLAVLAVNAEGRKRPAADGSGRPRWEDEIAGLGVRFPILVDGELEIWRTYCIDALPTSVVLDRKGVVRLAEPNYSWASQRKLRSVLTELGVSGP